MHKVICSTKKHVIKEYPVPSVVYFEVCQTPENWFIVRRVKFWGARSIKSIKNREYFRKYSDLRSRRFASQAYAQNYAAKLSKAAQKRGAK